LRTSFDLTSYSEPIQLVHRNAEFNVKVEDLRYLSYDEQQAALEAFWTVEKARLFDISHPPLMRFHIHRRTEDTLQLTMTELHAISDGWSTTSTLAEIFKNYLAIIGNRSLPDAPPIASTYSDFVILEREAIQSEECQQYWSQKLSDATAMKLPRWPNQFRSHTEQPSRKRMFLLSEDLIDGLNRLARVASVPLKSVLLAAHLKVMGLLSGQTDVMTGLVCNGRPEEVDGEQVRGLFLNTLPFRINLASGSWMELVRATFAAEVEMLPYRRYPLAALQEKWGSEPLFETAYSFLHFHSVQELFTGDDFEYLTYGDRDLSVTNFAFTTVFMVNPAERSRFSLVLDHDPAVVTEQQFEAIHRYLEKVLESMVADPNAPHNNQSFLSDKEQSQLLVEWNATAADYPRDTTAQQLFESQVEKTPHAVALVVQDESLTYSELNRRANQLAHYLQSRGAGPDVLLGICLERSMDMIVAILATVKAGSAYVPFDPKNPPGRLALMLQDSRVHLLLTQSHLLQGVSLKDIPLVCLDREDALISRESFENPQSLTNAQNLAYVIYTSGSTGNPKGVEIQHGGLMNLVTWQQKSYELDSDARGTQLCNQSFDGSMLEVWPYLTSGGMLFLVDEETLLTPSKLWPWLVKQKITHCFMPTPLAEAVLPLAARDGAEGTPIALRYLLTGGDKLHQSVEETVPFVLVNLYGPTENTVISTGGVVDPDRDRSIPPSIGRPIRNTHTYVLGPDGWPVPVGVAGELHLGGDQLARGYLHRPAITAATFIPNAFSDKPGARLYKTGDLVRYLPDGSLDFIGRIDQQIKLRGFRVELGEIETALHRHPSVKEAVVLAKGATSAERRIVAYLVLETEAPSTIEELRRFLRESLPDYMIPSGFITLEKFPLNPNGKVDRRALPAPEHLDLEGETYVPPNTPIEEVLSEIWAGVLGLERVGIHDNFFDLGGHSLLATSVMSRVRETFQLEISLRALFEAPTVSGLAQEVESAIRARQSLHVPPLERVANRNHLPLSFAQQRVWFFDQMEPGNAAYNIPFAVRLKGELNVPAMERALSEIVRRHEALRTTFPTVDNIPVQHIASPQPLALPLFDLSALDESQRESEVEKLATLEARRSFDLTRGPLLRATLLRVAADEHVALLTMHHIVSDGWSIGILVRELATLYRSFNQEQEAGLPELPIQYGDYAMWQREWLQGEVLEGELSYWREQLAGASALELPVDHARSAAQGFHGSHASLMLTPELSAELKQLGRGEGATLFMTFLSAFSILLQRYTGQKDIVIGSPVAGRSRSETEGLIGFFVNVLALRTRLNDNPTFYELLKQVREMTLGAYTHQELPFEKLIEELHPDRNQSYAPLYNVMFIFQNAPASTLELPGLELSLVDVDKGTAKLDLSVYVTDTRQGLALAIAYNTELFKHQTIVEMLGRFETLLENIVRAPANRISTFSIVSTAENEELVTSFNEPLEVF
jgi:amino acid adenylation domain-containing protein